MWSTHLTGQWPVSHSSDVSRALSSGRKQPSVMGRTLCARARYWSREMASRGACLKPWSECSRKLQPVWGISAKVNKTAEKIDTVFAQREAIKDGSLPLRCSE